MTDERPRGLQLNDKQIVFSVMAATVVAVVVFLCGVFVGRGVEAFRPAADVPVADTRVVPDAAPPAVEAEAGAAVEGDVSSGAVPPENLTYPDRLTKPQPPRETLPASTADGAPLPPPEVPEETPGSTSGGSSPDTGSAAGPAAGSSSPRPANTAAVEPAAGAYTVQVFAVRRKAEAQDLVDLLKKKGFPAYVFEPPPGDARGGFRVRVGSFKSRQEAAVMAARLQKAKYQPWITR